MVFLVRSISSSLRVHLRVQSSPHSGAGVTKYTHMSRRRKNVGSQSSSSRFAPPIQASEEPCHFDQGKADFHDFAWSQSSSKASKSATLVSLFALQASVASPPLSLSLSVPLPLVPSFGLVFSRSGLASLDPGFSSRLSFFSSTSTLAHERCSLLDYLNPR